jgi:predicted dehydrogenase
MMEKLPVGVIGVGYLGRFHAEKYAGMPDVELVGVVDIDPRRADHVARALATQAFRELDALLGRVAAVSIVVPTSDHYAVAERCLRHGCDVLVEKPMTTTLEQADALIDMAERHGRILQVGHLERFNPVVVALQERLTTPRFIESHRLGIFKDRCTDVSVVLDLMIHDIDLIVSFVRSEVTSIHAAGIPVISAEVDIANARLEFANGCVANVTASRISTKQERKIRIFQRDAYLSVDFIGHDIHLAQQDGSFTLGPIPGVRLSHVSVEPGDALRDELRSFVGAARRQHAPVVDGRMGRDALAIALSIMEQITRSAARLQGGTEP